MAADLAPSFRLLRRSTLSGLDRETELDRLYRAAASIVDPSSSEAWRTVTEIGAGADGSSPF